MKVLDAVLDNLLAQSQARTRAAMSESVATRSQSARLRQDQVRTLAGSDARKLRSLLGLLEQKAARLVSSRSDSVFGSSESAEVVSSRPTVARARVLRDAGRVYDTRYEVRVSRLAERQVNRGSSLADSASSAAQIGENTFTVSSGSGPTTSISVEIAPGDSNREALEKIEEAINGAGAGVVAELVSDSAQGTSYLLVSAEDTGAEAAFSLADASGNVVSATGIAAVQTVAKDAQYVLNGTPLASGSNVVSVDDGRVEITFVGVSGPAGGALEAAAVIEVGADPLPQAVLDLAEAYNRVRDFLEAKPSRKAQALLAQLARIGSAHASDLTGIGLKQGAAGELVVDRSLLKRSSAGTPERVEAVLGGAQGFATELYGFSNQTLGDIFSDPAGRNGALIAYGFSFARGLGGRGVALGQGVRIDFLA